MEATEISLIILRHLAREGCTESIKTYLQECPSMRQASAGRTGLAPELDMLRNKLLTCSVNLSLVDLLTDYRRAKLMIQELVSKIVNDWKAVSALYLSPHDSMATQLAHISNLLESKFNRYSKVSVCVGTSDDEQNLLPVVPVKEFVDAAIQVEVQMESENHLKDDQPAIGPKLVSTLYNPPVLEKIVELANNELNRSNNSTENIRPVDNDVEIDQVLLEILNGFGGSNTNSCLNNDIGLRDNSVALDMDSQLHSLFQEAQNVIVDTPIAGTLVRPEDSALKQRPCGSFLDLVETPFKQHFLATPLGKQPQQQYQAITVEKSNLKTVELNFGAAAAASSCQVGPATLVAQEAQISTAPKQVQQKIPRYSILQNDAKSNLSSEIDRLKRKRNLTPKIPATQTANAQENKEQNKPTAVQGSASKRKVNTPVKWTPSKGTESHLNFFCPTNSSRKNSGPVSRGSALDRTIEPSPPKVPNTSSITTPYKDQEPVALASSTPLPSINNDSVRTNDGPKSDDHVSNSKPNETFLTTRDLTSPTFANADMSLNATNYNRLLSSVRHNRPSIPLTQKKSFSTPRKKGHIRSLLFKTPPSGNEKSKAFDLSCDSSSGKRKVSPVLVCKSKKRLKWTILTPTAETSVEASQVITESSNVNATPVQVNQTDAEMSLPEPEVAAAQDIVAEPAVTTRSRAASKRKTTKTSGSSEDKLLAKNMAVPLGSGLSTSTPEDVPSPPKANLKAKASPGPRPRRGKGKRPELVAAEAAANTAVPLGGSKLVTSQRITRGQKALASGKVMGNATVANVAVTAVKTSSSGPTLRPRNAEAIGIGESNDPLNKTTSFNESASRSEQSSALTSDSSFDVSTGRSTTRNPSIPGTSQLSVPYVSTRQAARKSLPTNQLQLSASSMPWNSGHEVVSNEVPITISIPENPDKHHKSLLVSLFGDSLSDIDTGKGTDDSEVSTTPDSPARETSRIGNAWTMRVRSPVKNQPKSPARTVSQGKRTPRRILPQPVPSNYQVPVFPPTPEHTSYTLSIQTSSNVSPPVPEVPSCSTMISKVLRNRSTDKLPKLNSDSSSDLSVPKTPRVKLISEESMHTRLFPSDSMKSSDTFSSLPIDFGVPETPGKSITALNPSVTSDKSQSSLFDTPIKGDDLHATTNNLNPSTSVPPRIKSGAPVRKSPRKSTNSQAPKRTSEKSKKPTPSRKPEDLNQSSKKSVSAENIVLPQVRQSALLHLNPVVQQRKEENSALPRSAQATQLSQSEERLANTFPNWFSSAKSRNIMILSKVAKKEKASMVNRFPNVVPSIEPPLATEPKSVKTANVIQGDCRTHSQSPRDVELQFAVGGRAKQLSLSEHESLIGLLQIGTTKTPQKKVPQMPLKDAQVQPGNLLNAIDVHKFLKSIHARD